MAKVHGPRRYLHMGRVNCKGVGLPEFPPGFGSSWDDWFQRCRDLVWLRREGWLRRGHGCQGGGPACIDSGCNAWLEDGGCLAGSVADEGTGLLAPPSPNLDCKHHQAAAPHGVQALTLTLSWATLCDRNVSLGKRLRYFDGMISPVTVFAAGNRTIYKTDLRNLNVLFRKLFRSFVGLPPLMDWTRPWHEILHDCNGRVNEFSALHGIK